VKSLDNSVLEVTGEDKPAIAREFFNECSESGLGRLTIMSNYAI